MLTVLRRVFGAKYFYFLREIIWFPVTKQKSNLFKNAWEISLLKFFILLKTQMPIFVAKTPVERDLPINDFYLIGQNATLINFFRSTMQVVKLLVVINSLLAKAPKICFFFCICIKKNTLPFCIAYGNHLFPNYKEFLYYFKNSKK